MDGLFASDARLQDYTILLPTRRAARNLQSIFIQQAGSGALLMPDIRPLGDVDVGDMVFAEAGAGQMFDNPEVPPAFSAISRDIALLTLVQKWQEVSDRAGGVASAAKLTTELTALLDTLHIEETDTDRLSGLVPEEHSHNWQQTLEFLDILTAAWPQHKKEVGRIDPGERRKLLLDRQRGLWAACPPAGPVLAAGSTGSIPATSRLLKDIAFSGNGAVVVPGLDTDMPSEGWEQLADEPSHPQSGLFHLCEAMELQRSDIRVFPGLRETGATEMRRTRAAFVNRALWPVSLTGRWVDLPAEDKPLKPVGGWQICEAPDARSEAGIVALALREVLETPGKTAMLVTPDRQLARRVTAYLKKWDIDIYDTAGQPLSRTGIGRFARLVMQAVIRDFPPVCLLALLKHPFCRMGRTPSGHCELTAGLEQTALRGVKPAGPGNGLARILARLEKTATDRPDIPLTRLTEFVTDLQRDFAPLLNLPATAALGAVGGALLEVMAQLSRDEDGVPALAQTGDGLQAGPASAGRLHEIEVFEAVMAEFVQAEDFQAERADWGALLDHWLRQTPVYPPVNVHPRLSIMGLLEARLVSADLVVLGGLNEGTWPALPDTGPWLSRPMRAELEMTAPERRIGLTAHDFAQAFSAPQVLLTRAKKISGTPQLPSRWISRLKALHAGCYNDRTAWPEAHHLAALWEEMDASGPARAEKRPEPKPPAETRPDSLSVTQIATLQTDPYAIYARHILKLEPLDPLESEATAAIRGSFIHKILEIFCKKHPKKLPGNAADELRQIGSDLAEESPEGRAVLLYWWPRFSAIADWMADFEQARRPQIRMIMPEIAGRLEFDVAGRPFTLNAKADRIELTRDGQVNILDYKTGQPPSTADMDNMRAPQMPLEAAIAMAGGFEGVPAGAVVKELSHVQVHGGYPAGTVRTEENPEQLAETALAGLQKLLAHYSDEATPYVPELHPNRTASSDYGHLARVQEWMSEEEN